jgi:hypothetical protein
VIVGITRGRGSVPVAGDGISSGFSANDFRTAIKFAMTMGAPPDPTQQVTFLIPVEQEFTRQDPAGDPYDWTSTPTVTAQAQTVQVPVAATFTAATTLQGEPVGVFAADRVTLTVLDDDWAQVTAVGDADEFTLGGVHYIIEPPGPVPVGLFDVTVYTITATARG